MSSSHHPSDDALERHLMGNPQSEAELEQVEEHLLACPACVERAERMQDYLEAIKNALPQLDSEDPPLDLQ